jgi:hypothetical protein
MTMVKPSSSMIAALLIAVSVSGNAGDNGAAINTAKYADRATLPDFTAGL